MNEAATVCPFYGVLVPCDGAFFTGGVSRCGNCTSYGRGYAISIDPRIFLEHLIANDAGLLTVAPWWCQLNPSIEKADEHSRMRE